MSDYIRRPNIRWARPEERMPKSANIRAKPGYKVFIGNRGEVMFSVPEPWFVSIGEDSIRINDKEPPDDNCILQVSIHYLPYRIDWSGLPVRQLVEDLPDTDDDGRKPLSRGKVIEVRRPDVEYAWRESRILDVKENREALSRLCLARARYIQALITFDLWSEDADKFNSVWDEVLRSLKVGCIPPAQEKLKPKKLSDYLH
jgi:hypothetical protein